MTTQTHLPSAYISYKVWVPVNTLSAKTVNTIKKKYSLYQYDENMCRTCSNLSERHNEICDECPRGAYQGQILFYAFRDIGKSEFIGLPVGDRHNYKEYGVDLDKYRVVDKRVESPFIYDVKFTGKLYSYQETVVDQYLESRYGMMQCPPRTGKGPMSVYLAVQFGQKTLFLAKQSEFLSQIESHIRSMTNIEELEQQAERKLCGFPKSLDDYDNFLFCVATYQRFIRDNGKRLLKRIKRNYGTVIIDEAHSAAALCFAEAVSTLYPKYLMGMTATPQRKDGKHIITEHLIGPVTARSKRESLPVTMSIFSTPVKMERVYKQFVYAMKFLAKNEKRNEFILKHVLHDLQDSSVSIVIPLLFRFHIDNMVNAINSDYGDTIAEPFVGGYQNKKKRENTLERAKSGQIRVVVGTRSLLQLGVDCPKWTMLYEVMPISNRPMLYQETSRIRTPDLSNPNKSPRIKFFVDVEIAQSLGCFRSTLGHLRCEEFKDYHWTDDSKKRLSEIVRGDKRYYGKDVDITTQSGYNQIQSPQGRSQNHTPLFETKPENSENISRRKRL